MTDESKTPDFQEEERKAFDYVARMPEGKLIHRYLRRVLETVVDIPDPCALQSHNGRRSLARDLMRLMAEGIETSDGRDSKRGDEPILGGRRKPVDAGSRHRGTDRRVELERGDGWLPDERYGQDGKLKPE